MKKIYKKSSKIDPNLPEKQPSPLFLALVLTGILALEMNPTLINEVDANAGGIESPQQEWNSKDELKQKEVQTFLGEATARVDGFLIEAALATPESEKLTQGDRLNLNQQLPPQVAAKLTQDLSRQTGIAVGKLKITQFSRQSWPDTCLGLAKSDEFCAQMVVDGWRVVISDGRQSWTYHTDAIGRMLRIENPISVVALPKGVETAVLRDAAAKSGLAVSALRVTEAKQQTWSDSCLGLGGISESCALMTVPGWRVTVSSGKRRWVYRTNQTGSVLRWDRAASQVSDAGSLEAEEIPAEELPEPLTKGMVFREISSGGITGRTYQTVLMEDGTLMRVLQGPENANDSGRQVFRVSVEEVKQFQKLLQRLQLERFNELSYPAPTGAADFITVTLTSSAGTTRYADLVRDRLPKPLQEAIQGWSLIVSTIK